MAAKTFDEWWNNYDAVIGREICCRDAWEAATKAVEEKLTAHNSTKSKILLDNVVKLQDISIDLMGAKNYPKVQRNIEKLDVIIAKLSDIC